MMGSAGNVGVEVIFDASDNSALPLIAQVIPTGVVNEWMRRWLFSMKYRVTTHKCILKQEYNQIMIRMRLGTGVTLCNDIKVKLWLPLIDDPEFSRQLISWATEY